MRTGESPLTPIRPKASVVGAGAVLIGGGALAQALPLLLGPWLARLYTPEQWGGYALFWAVATNLAVVACARFDFALPLARSDGEARDLVVLCTRIGSWVIAATLLAVALVTATTAFLWPGAGLAAPGPATAFAWGGAGWWALPLAVALLAVIQLATLVATRDERFGAISASRLVQHGGGAVAQGMAAVVGWGGAVGLVGGAVVASACAAWVAWWGRPAAVAASVQAAPGTPAPPRWPWQPWPAGRALARRFRDFPLFNTPHAFLGALQDTAAVALIAAFAGPAAAGVWALSLRYLKAPATLVGGAVSQMLYPSLAKRDAASGLLLLRRVVLGLVAVAVVLGACTYLFADTAFGWLFGAQWASAGPLAQALAVYVAAHFVASPLGVVTLAWRAQAWALKLAAVGQAVFLAALLLGLSGGLGPPGLPGAATAVSLAMLGFYAIYVGWLLIAPPRDNTSH